MPKLELVDMVYDDGFVVHCDPSLFEKQDFGLIRKHCDQQATTQSLLALDPDFGSGWPGGKNPANG